MQGHQNLIALRRSGLKPSGYVEIADYPVKAEFLRWDFTEDGQFPTVCTDGDAIEVLDLRFLVSLSVHVIGNNPKRVSSLAKKAREMGADMVVCIAGDKGAIWRKGEAAWLRF